MAGILQTTSKILSSIVLLCVTLGIIYWAMAALKVGHFPTYSSNLKWRPYLVFRIIIGWNLPISLWAIFGLCMTNMIALLKREWMLSRQLYLFGTSALLAFALFWMTDFWNWFLD